MVIVVEVLPLFPLFIIHYNPRRRGIVTAIGVVLNGFPDKRISWNNSGSLNSQAYHMFSQFSTL